MKTGSLFLPPLKAGQAQRLPRNICGAVGLSRIRGFTLTEMLMTVGVFSVIMSGVFAVYISGQKVWHQTSVNMRTANEASLIVEKMVYGISLYSGVRAAKGSTVNIVPSGNDWALSYESADSVTNLFEYDSGLGRISYSNTGSVSNPIVTGEDVSGASVSNTGDGLVISVVVSITEGRFSSVNTVNSYVNYRN
ncbi:type II secretion system protein J [Verrucomicrobiota bacterium]